MSVCNRVHHWDVMNEMVQGHWYEEKTKDPDFTKKIFAKIHQADPNVKLFLNEDHVVSSGVATSVDTVSMWFMLTELM